MKYFRWVDSKIKYLRWFDISLIKLSTAAAILLIAKVWPPLLALNWYWYLVIAIIAAIRPMAVVFKKA